jgi:PKD repeat protein
MKLNLLVSFCLIYYGMLSQSKPKDTVTRRANIVFQQKGNTTKFLAETPPLIPIAGAPKPSFTYLWEFGDGNYSKQATPSHVYKSKGNYTARVSVINNYDNGKPPVTRPKKIAVNDLDNPLYNNIASIEAENGLQIFKNCDPIPDQEIVIVVGYQNLENYVCDGKIYLFYNEKQFKNNNFTLTDYRTHFGERETKNNLLASEFLNDDNQFLAAENYMDIKTKYQITTLEDDLEASLKLANETYKNSLAFEFDAQNPSETRNLFFTFKTTPEMLKDTSATVTMRSIYVPNRSYKNHKVKNLEMQIVTSHDPNKMGSNGSFLNYRLVRFKRINFKTRFQNNGEGPARLIKLETDIPEMFDKKTFQVDDMYPKCLICPKNEVVTYSCLDTIIKKDQIHFTFKNIYLPGSTQKNVNEIDSTKGFVKYSMKFNKDFHKIKTRSRTAIFFDKNEPILTNYATTRFLPGISIGAKAGYSYYPKRNNSQSYFAGATLSPFKSYRWYWQVEWTNNLNRFSAEKIASEKIVQMNGNTSLQRTTTTADNKSLNWEIPVLMRYNINNFVGIGAGIQGNINVSEKNSVNTLIESFEGPRPDIILKSTTMNTEEKSNFTNFKYGLLFDATIGGARIGPSLGFRYVMNFKENFNYFQIYGLWKF